MSEAVLAFHSTSLWPTGYVCEATWWWVWTSLTKHARQRKERIMYMQQTVVTTRPFQSCGLCTVEVFQYLLSQPNNLYVYFFSVWKICQSSSASSPFTPAGIPALLLGGSREHCVTEVMLRLSSCAIPYLPFKNSFFQLSQDLLV